MVLMSAKQNVEMGNKPFVEKRVALSASPFVLTSETAQQDDWGPQQIEARQLRLAKLAPKVWPL
jgi:hypothetical protein